MKTSINTNLAAAILSGATDSEPVKVYKIKAPDVGWDSAPNYLREKTGHICPADYRPPRRRRKRR